MAKNTKSPSSRRKAASSGGSQVAPPDAVSVSAPGEQAVPAKRGATAVPVVGIGCSAGGLEALELFFGQVSSDSDAAFVVIQHLNPDFPSILPDLIGRAARLPVSEAKNHMKIKAGNVYVIPPDRDLTLLHDTLYLLEPVRHSGLRLPVDFFLRTLAEDKGELAVGVILSGMGSDGMLGLRAIKGKGGLVLAQDPAEAKFAGMPESAIEDGLVDLVASAADLPGHIAAYLDRRYRITGGEKPASPTEASALEKIIILLRERRSADFSEYKTSTLYRRIERRTVLHQLHGIGAYLRYARENPQELDFLFKELLIGVTNFFRDHAVWEALCNTALPELLSQHPNGAAFRAWVPACSSGEEAYSLAIVFKETLETLKPGARFTLQIYATDIDADAIEKARRGVFPDNIVGDVSPERLARYFISDGGSYRVSKEIRDMVVFAPQNIISDPPFTKLDILSCRNLLIYFSPSLQKRLLPLFHYALNPDGLLVLGSAETVGIFTELFEPVDGKSRVFRRMEKQLSDLRPDFPIRPVVEISPERGGPEIVSIRESLEFQIDQFIQQTYAPPAVLVNGEGDIVYISGRTGKYLEPAAGKVNINVHAMARPGLREALTGVIRNALRQPDPIRVNGLQVVSEGGAQIVDLVVQGLNHPEALRGRVLIVFYDVPAQRSDAKGRRKKAGTEAEQEPELQRIRDALRVAHEEMQTSVEEYKSANEELQSTNEELQSTNEELTTSKEELQSLNEELQTVNAELQSKVDELTGVRNDMNNVLNSIEIATIFLDNALKLRRFTAHVTLLFKLIPGDVGRPLSDIVTELDYPQLKDDAQEVLRTLVFREQQVSTHDGRWFRVRIMPYRTLENLIDGVVITFIDITQTKQLEAKLRQLSQSPGDGSPTAE